MTTIVFEDGGWTVATSAWTVVTTGSDWIEVHYSWTSVDYTGVAKCTLQIPMETFLKHVARGGTVDLRSEGK
jgi:hypothetical protein